ncbi:VOC family protein [Roseomonas sp. OT10]|uniref:VOC family protein n=1 Tax=Roseomonas cutis TaxID=2897332 RepID=UPI001E4C47FA|nr:VOC family protein [Roseomonas sp. OT10]UFN49012.1 VOC family protein [Roseomonas sp. OT10]
MPDQVPPLQGVLETALYVEDMPRARAFYEGVMGLAAMYEDERLTAYPVGGRSALLLFRRDQMNRAEHPPGGTIPPHAGSGPVHFALAVDLPDLPRWEAHLAGQGVALEGRVDWPQGARSIYFRDPDAHLVELVTPGLWAIY